MRSLRVNLLILVLGAMLPGVLLSMLLVWRAFSGTREVVARRIVDTARVEAAVLDKQFTTTIRTLDALASSPALTDGELRAFYDESRRVQSTQEDWYSIVLLSADGQQLINTRLDWGVPLEKVVDQDSFDRVLRERQPIVGSIRTAPSGGSDYLFPVRVPVVRDNEIKYVLSAILNVHTLVTDVPRLREADEWTRAILDPSDIIAVRTRGKGEFIGQPATPAFREAIRNKPGEISRQETLEGTSAYTAIVRSAYGWTAAVAVPTAVLDAPLEASIRGLLLGGAVLMLSGFGAVFLVSRRLTADLKAATAAAEAVADGRPIEASTGHVAETVRLQRSLTRAAALLDERARDRDKEVRRAEAARREAEHANRTKDQFLAVLGHELRNPLAPAVTALELMKARNPDVFKRERAVLERQVVHMVRLVNDLLDVSRLTRGKVHLRRSRFELRDAVSRAVDMARPLMIEYAHDFDVKVPGEGFVIDGDIDRIVQVLSNLLTNAARYTPPGGSVSLTAIRDGAHVVIACEDTGPGIPADLAPSLFEPFAQGPRALDRREGGLGLGLALARTFTDLHGGTIRLDTPSTGRGTRVVVTLPSASDTTLDRQAPPPRSASPRRPASLLVVDDNVDAREMLQTALSEAGHTVAVAGTGHEAIAMASGQSFDAAILDIGLPGMNGYDLAHHLRKMHPGMRLVALTGYGQQSDLDAAVAAGFDAHYAKPIRIETLLDDIASAAGAPT